MIWQIAILVFNDKMWKWRRI